MKTFLITAAILLTIYLQSLICFSADNIGVSLLVATGVGIAAHAAVSAIKNPKVEE
jgi:hypothetical protein